MKSDAKYIEILEGNLGFEDPGLWLSLAKDLDFKRIKSSRRLNCPSCGSKKSKFFSQYVYYSTLHKLLTCKNCKLIYSNVLLDEDVVSSHFERGYKDEGYFLRKRKDIFKQIASFAGKECSSGAEVLDVGGAKGHFLHMLQKERSDLKFSLSDISKEACEAATKSYGFKSIQSSLAGLPESGVQYDCMFLLDVLYYEPELKKAWKVIDSLSSSKGMLILRLPNKKFLISLSQILFKLFSSKRSKELQTKVRFFNPEHIYIFNKTYLSSQLSKFGFKRIEVRPAKALACSGFRGVVLQLYYLLAVTVWYLSFFKIVITPSMLVVGRR